MVNKRQSDQSIGDKVANGAVWTLSMRMIVRIFGLLNIAILARLLTKEDFGIVALLISTSAVLSLLLEMIIRTGLIRVQDIRDEHYGVAFAIRLIGGALAAVILALAASPIAIFFSTPDLKIGLYVFAAILFAEGLASPWVMGFQRNMQFSKDFTFEVIVGLGRVAVSVICAFWLQNFWALVAGIGASAILRIFVSYAMCYGAPLKFDRLAFFDLWHVFKWSTIEGFAGFADQRVDKLILGKIGTAAQLGVFSMVVDLVMLPIGNLILPIGRAVLPGLHKMRTELPDKAAVAYGVAVSSMVAVSLPVAFGVLMVSDSLIRTLLGDDWSDSIILLQYLVPFILAESIIVSFNQVLVADGSLRAVTGLRVTRTILYIPAMYFGFLGYGLEGAILAKSIIAVLSVVPAFLILIKGGRICWDSSAWQIVRSAFACLIMVYCWYIALPEIQALFVVSAVQLIVIGLMGALIYGGSLLAIWHFTGRKDGIETRLIIMVSNKLSKV